ncbi:MULTISPECIES: hypothetical protein [unclassified Mesorhizobium]|uniref:hypothetical protein n=1 Tax=unclassified Mesorhizobium TaxID=325217 RepID=UPI002415C2DA|nr:MULTISPECIES: hypothetical protein [unclassified Mesorhizobium]MDG4902778.1 hypothetical protein [Mesorhizobium sp. WSM4962]MDG4920787.1 hypothetical protein [Mesorhizobium sp. WSM4989]
MPALMTFAEYAAAIGVNASTVSRAVTKGSIPVVELADGRRMIDREAADKARRENTNIRFGHGGRADRAIRRETLWKRKNETGYNPQVRAILNFMLRAWPTAMQHGMAVLGAEEVDQARALLTLRELIGFLAVSHHDDAREADYRKCLAPEIFPSFTDEDARQLLQTWGDEEVIGSGKWTCADQGLPGGADFYDDLAELTFSAFPS